MARFAQAVVLGLLQGGLYGLVGVGFSLVWGVTNVVNVAHGAFVVVGAYIAWELQATFGVDPLLGMVVSAGALFVAGYALQRGLVNLVVNAPIWMTLLLTFGLELAIVNGLVYTLSGDLRAIPTSWARDGFTLAGAAFAVAAGIPVLRLRGHYFAIATLGIAEGMREVVINLPSLTGGGAGITVPAVGARATTTYLGNDGFYWCFLVLAALATATVGVVVRSRFGYALRAIRQDEAGAGALGIDTTRVKVAAFALSGALTAAAGAVYAFQQVTIYPDRLFSVEITVLAVAMAVVGGAGTVAGPLLGAGALQLLSEYLRQRYLGLHLAVFGAVLVASVVFVPQGLVSFTRQSVAERRLALLDNVRRHRV